MDIIECIAGHDYIRTKSNYDCPYCRLSAAEAEKKRLREALIKAKEKLGIYRSERGITGVSEYTGGMEYRMLIEFIDQALAEKP